MAASGTYEAPSWSSRPGFPLAFEVIKSGCVIDRIPLEDREFVRIGRQEWNDIAMEHPSISREHAVLQLREKGRMYLIDCGSTHGTVINKKRIPAREYVRVRVGDVLRFGQSSRLFVVDGPEELRPSEEKQRRSNTAPACPSSTAASSSAPQQARGTHGAAPESASWGFGEDAVQHQYAAADELQAAFEGQNVVSDKHRELVQERQTALAKLERLRNELKKQSTGSNAVEALHKSIMKTEEKIEDIESRIQSIVESSTGGEEQKAIKSASRKRKALYEANLMDDEDDFYDRTKSTNQEKKSRNDDDEEEFESASSLRRKLRDIAEKREKVEKDLQLLDHDRSNEDKADRKNGDEEEEDDFEAYMRGIKEKNKEDRRSQLEVQRNDLKVEEHRLERLLQLALPAHEKLTLSSSHNKKESTSVPPHGGSSHRTVVTAVERVDDMERERINRERRIAAEKVRMKNERDAKRYAQSTTHTVNPDEEHHDGAQESHASIPARTTATEACEDDVGEEEGTVGEEEGSRVGLGGNTVHRSGGGGNGRTTGQHDTRDSGGIAGVSADIVAQMRRALERNQAARGSSARRLGGAVESDRRARAPQPPQRPAPSQSTGNHDPEEWIPPQDQSGDGRTKLNDLYGY